MPQASVEPVEHAVHEEHPLQEPPKYSRMEYQKVTNAGGSSSYATCSVIYERTPCAISITNTFNRLKKTL